MLMSPSPQLQVTNVTHQICNLSGLSLISVQARHCCLQTVFHHCLICKHTGVQKKHSIYLQQYQHGRFIKNQDQWFQTISSTLSTPTLRLSRSSRSLCRCQLFSLDAALQPCNKYGHFGYQQKHGEKTSLTQPSTSMKSRWDHNILMLISETSLGMDGSIND